MKILAHTYTYGNNAASGADKMLQSLMEYLAARGCECYVVIDNCPNSYVLNGVNVLTNKYLLGEWYDWCDIVIIHLVAMHEAHRIAARFEKPVIHICHNNHIRIETGYAVYNSYHLSDSMRLPLPSIVVHPPTKPVQNEPIHYGQPYITLVNVNANKGGEIFLALARALPQYRFLGVHGGYDRNQLMQPLPNIMYRNYIPAGMDYSDTRIIIVPSKSESWSLVAAEAMARGIPVICSDLPGLRENCGDAAIYAASVRDYVEAIRLLDDELYYYVKSLGCRARFALHNYTDELNNFFNFIENIVMQGNNSEIFEAHMDAQVKESKEKPESKGIIAEKVERKPRKEKRESKGLPTNKIK